MPGHPIQHPVPQHLPPQGQRGMPGSYPEQMQGVRHVRGPAIEVLDPGYLKNQKSKHKGGHHSSSESTSDSGGSWEDESENSSFVNIEYGDYDNGGRRGRGRRQHSSKSKKGRKHRSQSKGKAYSRSRSHSRPRKIIVDPYIEKSSRRRQDGDLIDERHPGRHSSTSSGATSPRSSHSKLSGQLPPIHIHMNTTNGAEDRTRSNNASPTDFYNEKRKPGKLNASHPMARDDSGSSWDRASGTNSFTTTSGHTADDSIFDTPLRRPSLKRGHSRRQSSYSARHQAAFDHPHAAYDDVDRRPAQKSRYPRETVNDYPHTPLRSNLQRESYFDEQPHPNYTAPRPDLPHRRNSMAVPPKHAHDPYAQPQFPAKPLRAQSYAADTGYPFSQQRFLPEREEHDERFGLRDIADALEHINETRQQQQRPLRRPNPMGRRDSAMYADEDEWDTRVPLRSGGRGYERYSAY
jgi:hypothetical protein